MRPRCYLQLAVTLLVTVRSKGFAFSAARRCRRDTPHIAPTTRTWTPKPFAAAVARSMMSTTSTSHDAASAEPARTDPLRELGLPSPLILGSASFTRKLILREMGIPFHIVVRPIDERSLGDRSHDPPHELVLNLAKAKMDHLVDEIRAGGCDDELPDRTKSGDSAAAAAGDEVEYVVLTGDQVVTCNGKILEKPENLEEARRMVQGYGAHPPSTVGSVVLTHLPSGRQVSGVDTATIHFANTVSGELVDEILKDDEDAPILSCAGGLMVEHPKVREHLLRIDGTEDSVMGLSKDLVLRLLKELAQSLGSPIA